GQIDDVRVWHSTDVTVTLTNVSYWGKSGRRNCITSDGRVRHATTSACMQSEEQRCNCGSLGARECSSRCWAAAAVQWAVVWYAAIPPTRSVPSRERSPLA